MVHRLLLLGLGDSTGEQSYDRTDHDGSSERGCKPEPKTDHRPAALFSDGREQLPSKKRKGEAAENPEDATGDAQLKQMELFREHKVNPLGGCLPMLLQFPVLIAMFTTMRVTFELLGEKFLWISDLSQPDAVMWFPGGGFWMFRSLNILPIVMVAAFYFQQRLSATTPKNPNDPQYQQQQLMGKLFPVLFGFIFYNMPSGLTLYFTFSTFLRIMQQLWVIKQPDEKMGAVQRQ